MSLYSQFGTDPKLEAEGVKIVYEDEALTEDKWPFFVIARMGGANVEFDKSIDTQTRSLRRALANDTVSGAKLKHITMTAFVETCLKSWGNIVDREGNTLQLSPKVAVEYFKSLPDLYQDLVNQSNNLNLYKPAKEADVKN